MNRLRRSKKSLTAKTHRRRLAAENRRSAADDEKDAVYHAEMADCLSVVGDQERARSERSRATILRRGAQIKRDLAVKYDPQPGATLRDDRSR